MESPPNSIRMSNRSWRIPLFLSGFILLFQSCPFPSPVRDAATLAWVPGVTLQLPLWHLFMTPFCSIADTLTALGLAEAYAVLIWALSLFFLVGGFKKGSLLTLGFLLFLAWGALVPHAMGRLVTQDPATVLIDFHSHSQFSHDGRPSFTPEANRRWHHDQGYEAAFITDHNRVEASQLAKAQSRLDWNTLGYRSLEGEEVSLQKTHLVILGNHLRVDNQPYDGDVAKIRDFILAMHQQGYPVIASLPEYWFYHWGQGVDDFIHWGMDGFEIINSAPKAMDFPIAKRLQIVDLCRSKNLFMTGISDNHGFGYATAAWNAMTIPNWQKMTPDELEKAILTTLANKKFEAVRVFERLRYVPDSTLGLIFAPLSIAVYYLRLLQPLQVLSWVLWIWILYALCTLYDRKN